MAAYENVIEDYERLARDGAMKCQEAFHYGGPPRGWEVWKRSEAARKVAYQPGVVRFLQDLMAGQPEPFQTLHFKQGSGQPLHQDFTHFSTMPPGFMFAAWTALEDVTPESGPFVICPGSHRLPAVEFSDLGLSPAKHGVKD